MSQKPKNHKINCICCICKAINGTRIFTDEYRKKLSIGKIGNKNPMKNLIFREKMRNSRIGQTSYWKGKKRQDIMGNNNPAKRPEIRKKLSKAMSRLITNSSSKAVSQKIYENIHYFLKKRYGKAYRCENKENDVLGFMCNDISKTYEWANKRDMPYKKDRNCFYQLCHSCHIKYDRLPIQMIPGGAVPFINLNR